MKLEYVARAFDRLGARFQIAHGRNPRWSDFTLDVAHDRRGQYFVLRGSADELASIELEVLQTQPHDRHLLLLVKSGTEAEARKDRFLCGHDEREWFVAAVPGGASTVLQAKEALKPDAVRQLQSRKGLSAREANQRRNAAFRRQGEWFFVPVEHPFGLKPNLILREEPIRRGNGKPHMVEELYRTGGETVYVNWRHPNGLTQSQHEELLHTDPNARTWTWTVMRRKPGVFARGAVRHSDHATIVLPGWHQVLMNTEDSAPTMARVAFLD